MDAAIGVADLFLEKGIIAGRTLRTGSYAAEAKPGVEWALPVLVLINAGTASSSEFLAAALRDHERARFMGQRTFGKGFVQMKFALSEGQGGVIVSTGRHVRPSGVAADRNDPEPAKSAAGVGPDPGLEVVVEGPEYESWAATMEMRAGPAQTTEADFADAKPDRMLESAIRLLGESVATPPAPASAPP